MLLDGYGGDNPIVGLSSSRPDFDGALLEFLVGMLAVSVRPTDSEHWLSLYETPPSVADLQARLAALPQAFDLVADAGARFLQDLNAADFESQAVMPVERLLIDTPGEQTVKQNKAHFVRPERFDALGLPAAAMALLTLQTYSPAGGAGHRTSMRGGGPLTTLAEPRRRADGDDQLWKLLWMNVPTHEEVRGELAPLAGLSGVQEDHHIFPWLARTRESVKGESVSSADAHPLQAFFGMPRRIRLELGGPGVCAFTGLVSACTVVGYRTRPYGVNYEHWKHPLSPHYQSKPGSGWLPVHGQPGGLSWRDWPSLALYQPTSDRQPAAVIRWARARARLLERRDLRLLAFGYDMDNMKARGWIASEQPLYPLDEQLAALLGNTVQSIVEAANLIASELSRQIRRAEFGDEKSASGDWGWVRETLFDATESDFHRALHACVSAGADADARVHFASRVGTALQSQAQAIFDRRCTLLGISVKMMQHGVVAREQLRSMLRGFSPLGEKMFSLLGLTPPGGGRAQRKQRKPLKEATP
jgi:CRISPR system Cascade subunit CasA